MSVELLQGPVEALVVDSNDILVSTFDSRGLKETSNSTFRELRVSNN